MTPAGKAGVRLPASPQHRQFPPWTLTAAWGMGRSCLLRISRMHRRPGDIKRLSKGSVPGPDLESRAVPTCPSGNVQSAPGCLGKASDAACWLPPGCPLALWAEPGAAVGRTQCRSSLMAWTPVLASLPPDLMAVAASLAALCPSVPQLPQVTLPRAVCRESHAAAGQHLLANTHCRSTVLPGLHGQARTHTRGF